MSDGSHIEWTDATWNPVTGCSIVSPGCTNCYAMSMAGRLEAISIAHEASHGGDPCPMERYRGTTEETRHGKSVWTGKVNFVPEVLAAPLRWKKPRRIFVNSMSDLFHESVPDEWIDQVFAVMALSPQHVFQVLTKRPARMRAYLSDPNADRPIHELACDMVVASRLQVVLIADRSNETSAPPGPRVFLDLWPLPNVWLGTSVEDQRRADERIPALLATPAAVRFISAEPLLGPINLHEVIPDPIIYNAVHGMGRLLHWVIVGGESGQGARPMHPDWARSLRDQCAAAGVPFFFKQWGEWAAAPEIVDAQGASFHRFSDGAWMQRISKKAAGRLLDGVAHNAMPAAGLAKAE